MTIYKIPVSWEMYGEMIIEADNLDDACKYALGSQPLPEGDYVDDSCYIDLTILEENYPSEPVSKDTLNKQNLL